MHPSRVAPSPVLASSCLVHHYLLSAFHVFFLLMVRLAPRSTLFPYTSLFRSMRLNGDSRVQPQLVSLWHSLAACQDYTLSCLLKSSEEDYPVHLSFSPGGGGTVKVDTAWRRYRQTFQAASSAMGMVYIRGEKQGSLWIDDVQLEEGSQIGRAHV